MSKQKQEVKEAQEEKEKEKIIESTEALKCQLTKEEFNERAKKLAETLDDLRQAEAERKAAVEQFKNKIASLEAQAAHLANVVRNGWEIRPVVVETTIYYKRNLLFKKRLDTQEQLERRELRPEERQMELV